MIDPTTTTAARGQTARSILVTELSDTKVRIANASYPKYRGQVSRVTAECEV